MAADKGTNDRAGSHDKQEHPISAQDRKAVVAAIAREPDEHGGKAHRQREASGELDIGAEQQHQRWNEKLTTGDTKKRGNDSNDEAGRHAGEKLRPAQK